MSAELPSDRRADEPVPRAELRASHADRDRVAELLRIAAGDGRLTAEELDQRLEKALTARTLGELAALSRDLPAPADVVAGIQVGEPKDVVRIERQGGNAKREGRWIVPQRIEVRVGWGHVTLDFTEAVISQPVLHIDAEVRSGTLTLLTIPGIEVDTDDVAVKSAGNVKVRVPRGPQVPVVLRVVVTGTVGSGHIRARPSRAGKRRAKVRGG